MPWNLGFVGVKEAAEEMQMFIRKGNGMRLFYDVLSRGVQAGAPANVVQEALCLALVERRGGYAPADAAGRNNRIQIECVEVL